MRLPLPCRVAILCNRRSFSSSVPCLSASVEKTPKASTTKSDRQLILNVLSTLPSQREARHFLKRFNQVPQEKQQNADIHYRDLVAAPIQRADELLAASKRQEHVGLIKVDASLTEVELSAFAGTLVQLQKLGLTPIVVIEPNSSANRTRVIEDLFRVVEAIDGAGGKAMALYSGVYETKDEGNVSVQFRPIQTVISLNQIPVLAPLGHASARLTTITSRDALVSLSAALANDTRFRSPVKTIFVNHRGGFTVHGRPIGFVNLEDEYDDLRAALSDQHGGAQQQLDDLETVRTVLSVLPSSSSAIIASPVSSASLISNLITDKPLSSTSFDPTSFSSCFFKDANGPNTPTVLRQGLRVQFHPSLATLDLRRLQVLLEASFQKSLEADAFWKRMDNVMDGVILAGDYDGAAIVTNEPDPDGVGNPIAYLDKFSVAPTSQGIGVADILWKQLRKRYKDLSWRSRAANPVNKWYFDRSDGNLKLPGHYWVLFWYGSQGVKRLNSYKEMARNIPASFLSPQKS